MYFIWFLTIVLSDAAQPSQILDPLFTPKYSHTPPGLSYSTFTGQTGPLKPYFISKLNFDAIPGRIVIGAADWLYVLNPNLTLAKEWNLPPRASAATCSAAIGYNPDYVCRNHLRVFFSSPIDPTMLVVCGSEAIGAPSCRAVNVMNLASYESKVAANGTVSICPAFYEYAIAYYNVSNPRGINFFAVSTLNLDANNTGLFFITVNYTNPSDPNSLYTELKLRTNSIANFRTPVFVDTYVANYAPRTTLLPGVMDTISPDEHKYFYVFVRDIDNQNNSVSQLIRICQNDPGNSDDNAPLTLVKARIDCMSAKYATNYNAIRGVAFNQMGRYYQEGDWALFMYGVFTTSIGGVDVSAVCVYPANNSVEDATGQFGRNRGVFDIFRTLLRNPNTGVLTTSGYIECTTNGNMARPDYTYTDTVLSIAQIGTEPLAVMTGVSITKIVLDQTCVVTSNISTRTCVIQDVLFLGTAAGTVLKVAIGYSSGSAFSIIAEEFKLDDTSSVRQMEMQQQGGVKYLYVNTDTSIYRLPVQRCGRFLSCSTCVGSRDPYCVWNTSLSQCVVSSIVPTNYNGVASVPNGIYQNIHTGVVNSCPVLPLDMAGPVLHPTQPALLGANSSILCTLYDGQNGATITSYQWAKNGVILTDGGRVSGTTQSTLLIINVTLQDQGMYQCSAINIDGVSTGLSNSTQVTASDIVVTGQPHKLTNILLGQTVNFSITAAGMGFISYQWLYGNGTNIPTGGRHQGVTTPTLVISPVMGGDNSSVYMCRVTSPSGNTTTTQPAYLLLASAPVITQQPIATSVTFGQNTSLSCSANGLGPLTVSWSTPPGITPPQSRQYSGYDITDTLVLSSVNTTHRGTYMCVVTDIRGIEVSSMPSILEVTVPTPNAVAMATVSLGVFTCNSNDGLGGATITSYQWVKNSIALSNGGRVAGTNQPTLSISNVMPQDQGLYQCNVTNVDGVSSLSVATSLLVVDMAILTQPSNLVGVALGSNVTLSIVAGGGGAISYAWQYTNGSQLSGYRFQGVSSPVLTIGPVSEADNGSSFNCLVTNRAGVSVASQVASIMLATTPLLRTHPTNTSTTVGSNITLTCVAVGLGTLSITWSTTSSLSLPPPIMVQPLPYTAVSTLFLGPLSVAHRGQYWCTVADFSGRVAVSSAAFVTV